MRHYQRVDLRDNFLATVVPSEILIVFSSGPSDNVCFLCFSMVMVRESQDHLHSLAQVQIDASLYQTAHEHTQRKTPWYIGQYDGLCA
jgi:hypothetical protein